MQIGCPSLNAQSRIICGTPHNKFVDNIQHYSTSLPTIAVDDICTFSCRSEAAAEAGHHHLNSAVSLPCGGYNVNSSSLPLSSMYSAAGPVLYNLTVTASHAAVFARQRVELVATAQSVAALTMPLGKFLCVNASLMSSCACFNSCFFSEHVDVCTGVFDNFWLLYCYFSGCIFTWLYMY